VKCRFAWLLFLLAAVQSGRGVESRAIPSPPVEGGYLKISFYWLSFFDYVRPLADAPPGPDGKPPTGEEQIPAAIKRWSGAKAEVTGYMVPTEFRDGKTTEFLLMANQMLCCYGTVPKVNDWILVHLPGGTEVIQDRPITFRGRFHVGAVVTDGILTAVYGLEAEAPGKVAD